MSGLPPTGSPDSAPDPRRWRLALRAIAVALGALYAAVAAWRESMNADGISYLDQGDAWLRGDWSMALNPVWSPLYAWLQGAALWLADPGPRGEPAIVHLVNFLIYLGALACFEFFWNRVSAAYARTGESSPTIGFPGRSWLCLGYALFIWSSLVLIEIWAVTPDMLVAACIYLAAGLLVRIRDGGAGTGTVLGLGAVLGIGYFAKAALFPIAFVFLLLGVIVAPGPRRRLARMAGAALVFVVVAGPLLVALSVKDGGPTFGGVGKLTYLKHVHGVPFPHYIPGLVDGLGEPDSPIRRLYEDPTVWEFAEPVGGTYPLSYDPHHWYRGLDAPFDLRRQLVALAINGEFYFELFVRRQGGLLALALLLWWLSWRHARRAHQPTCGRWELLVIVLAGVGMYALVHVTWRYLAGYVILLWAGLLTGVRLPDGPRHRRLLKTAGVMMVVFVALDFAVESWRQAKPLLQVPPAVEIDSALLSPEARGGLVDAKPNAPAATLRPSRIAEALLAAGLRRGDRVGFVGYSFDAFWARLARLKIVAEIVPAEAHLLWQAGPARQAEILRAFAGAGAVAVVTDSYPRDAALPGWGRLGESGYAIYHLGPGTANAVQEPESSGGQS